MLLDCSGFFSFFRLFQFCCFRVLGQTFWSSLSFFFASEDHVDSKNSKTGAAAPNQIDYLMRRIFIDFELGKTEQFGYRDIIHQNVSDLTRDVPSPVGV
ncbi:hypothetical protein RIR_jg3175.t1 [Rhizophagus irregularis DAOM 181602=DAOM 197198]|nr:hypothetical protein RIR_jg3175.t1 [Rhizophagus irregularis DAOM 181602=DAOM 197198]